MLVFSASANGAGPAVLLPAARAARVSLEATDVTAIALHIRTGETGAWLPVVKGGTPVSLTSSDPHVTIAAGQVYLRATASGNTGVAFKVVAQGVDL